MSSEQASARVLLADDHPMVLMIVRETLEDGGFTVCAEAYDADGALALALETRPDVCLLDVNMPGGGAEHGGGIAAAAAIRSRLPGTKVLLLSVSRGDRDLVAAVRAGASGYLLKDVDLDYLPGALRSALSGDAVIPLSALARLVDQLERPSRWRRLLGRSVPARLLPRSDAPATAGNVGLPPAAGGA